jgi:GDP-L-fucose synthase
MEKNERIFVAGHKGMVGSAIVRRLKSEGYTNLLLIDSSQLDLRDQSAVLETFKLNKIDYVFIAAGKVGGIKANMDRPAEFIYDNLMIQLNLIHSSYIYKVKKLVLLGSSCIYPKLSPQPISEDSLLSGHLEVTNEAYAIAKISGVELCKFYSRQYGCNFISLMPTNLYGINDNFNLETSHVLPALLRKVHEAKINNLQHVEVWGSGNPRREFLHVDDLADACLFMMKNYEGESHINIGSGEEVSIIKLVEIIARVVQFKGKIKFDSTKPDGTQRKKLDTTMANSLGWKSNITLEQGIMDTYKWFISNQRLVKY